MLESDSWQRCLMWCAAPPSLLGKTRCCSHGDHNRKDAVTQRGRVLGEAPWHSRKSTSDPGQGNRPISQRFRKAAFALNVLQNLQWNVFSFSSSSGDKAAAKRCRKVKTSVLEEIETSFITGNNTEPCKNTCICLKYRSITACLHESDS